MLANESLDTIDDGRVEVWVVVDGRRHLLSDGRVLLPREETVENRTSPVGLVSRDSPKAVPKRPARVCVWKPWYH